MNFGLVLLIRHGLSLTEQAPKFCLFTCKTACNHYINGDILPGKLVFWLIDITAESDHDVLSPHQPA